MSVRHPLDVDPRPRVREAALPASGAAPVAADHPVLRDTYRLLSMTLLFSGAVAVGTAALGLPGPGLWLTLGGFFGLLALTSWLSSQTMAR